MEVTRPPHLRDHRSILFKGQQEVYWTGSSTTTLRQQDLALLTFTGIFVDDDGRIAEGQGIPTIDEPAEEKRCRLPFDIKDDRVLSEWVSKAAAEGISLKGPNVFKDLERLVRI